MSQYVRILQFSVRPTFGHQQKGLSNWIGSREVRHSQSYWEYQYFHPFILATGYCLYKAGLHSDIYLSSLFKLLSPPQLKQMVSKASIVQVEHPWLFDLALQISKGKPLIYIAHNVEADLWENQTVNINPLIRHWIKKPRELEKRAVQKATATVAMSDRDAKTLVNLYGANHKKISIIPNGVDLKKRKPSPLTDRIYARERLKLDQRPVLLFIGSDHYPNKEALTHIQQWQTQLGNELGILILVVGKVGYGFQDTKTLRFEGFVEDVSDYLSAADIALNPITRGSGTSLKAVEYLACGLPTISTTVGIRGLNLRPGEDILIGDISDFPQLITRLVQDELLRGKLSQNGRQAVAQIYSWERLGKCMLEIYQRVSR